MNQEDTRQVLLEQARRTTTYGLARSILNPDLGFERAGGLTEAGRLVVIEVARIALAERREQEVTA